MKRYTLPLSVTHQTVAAEWHPEKNNDLKPSDITAGSGRQVWWQCQNNHEWIAKIANRTLNKSGCPECFGRRVSSTYCLAAKFPEVAREWNYELNGSLTPENVSPGSSRKVWWRCKLNRDHVWDTVVKHRTGKAKSGCPYCGHHRPTPKKNLAAKHPLIAEQWHPRKNNPLKPTEVRPNSHKRVWWQCPKEKSHEWQEFIDQRVSKKLGCPYCSGKRPHATNCLATKYPQIAAEWHPTKNGKLKPTDVTPFSGKSVCWRCPTDPTHEYKCKIARRTVANKRCTLCIKQDKAARSLAALLPELAKEWHPERNGNLAPDSVGAHSARCVWWQCPKIPEHVWLGRIASRTQHWQDCVLCRKAEERERSLAVLYPNIASEFDIEKNAPLTPIDILGKSSKLVWWRCRKDSNHSWQMAVSVRTSNHGGCPDCRNSSKPACARQ